MAYTENISTKSNDDIIDEDDWNQIVNNFLALVQGMDDPIIMLDNVSVGLGTTSRGTILHDGTNLIIKPDAVGSGYINLDGDVIVSDAHGMVIGHTAQLSVGSATSELQVLGTAQADASGVFGRFSADASGPVLDFLKSRNATIGSNTIVQSGDDVATIRFVVDDGTDYVSQVAAILVEVDGTPGANDTPGRIEFRTTPSGQAATSSRMRIDSSGNVFINDTSNANMTVGLTINQGANDDEILALKSSDIAHALTASSETDTYLFIKKFSAAQGGAIIHAVAEDATQNAVLQVNAEGGQATTAKTTAARAQIEFYVAEHDGAGNVANVTADGNVFVVRAQVGGSGVARMLVDEDGDFYTVTAAQTFDAHDDLALVDTYDAIRSNYREWAAEHEDELVRLKVLGAPVAEGGLTNVTQLQRLHNGAIRQLGAKVAELSGKLELAERKLAALGA